MLRLYGDTAQLIQVAIGLPLTINDLVIRRKVTFTDRRKYDFLKICRRAANRALSKGHQVLFGDQAKFAGGRVQWIGQGSDARLGAPHLGSENRMVTFHEPCLACALALVVQFGRHFVLANRAVAGDAAFNSSPVN